MNRILLTLTFAMLAAACDAGGDEERMAAAAATMETPEASAEMLAPIREASVAIVEISDGAVRRAVNADVRQYATVVTTDHRGLVQALDSVAQQRGAGITQTPAAQEMENSVRMAHAGLDGLSGPDYDLPYIRAQVETHRQMLDRLELELIPSATSESMRSLLRDVHASEEAHLTRARQLLAALLGEPSEPDAGSRQGTTPMGPVGVPPDTGLVRPDTGSVRQDAGSVR